MVETTYGIKKATLRLLARDLLTVRHENAVFDVSHPAFGPNTYVNNLTEMQNSYFHSQELPNISFREPTTSESISVATYYPKTAKIEILDPGWLQLGRIVKTSEGVYANPPKGEKGDVLFDESVLNTLRNKAKKVNGIYLGDNDFGFAPRESFTQGNQKFGIFVEQGLARLLEHTRGNAKNMGKMSEFYPKGVNVFGFDGVDEPVVRFASLYSGRGLGGDWLGVDGLWYGNDVGCVFGVLVAGEASVPKKI